jgi:hypothetical protein
LLLVIIIAMVSACSSMKTTSVRENPDFASAKRTIRSIAILRPEVEVTRIAFTGDNDHDASAEDDIRGKLCVTMQDTLKARGYEVKDQLIDQLNGDDKQLNFDFEQLKTAYTQVSKELYAKRLVSEQEVATFKVSVGSVANTFAVAGKADALLYSRYAGFTKTQGQIAKDIVAASLIGVLTGVVAVPAPQGGTVEVALIDGTSGDVLWANTLSGPMAGTPFFESILTSVPQSLTNDLAMETEQTPSEGSAKLTR